MSQVAGIARHSPAESARPQRSTADYAAAFIIRLRKLAAAQSTGTLPFSGRTHGAIHFRDGLVSAAESSGTLAGTPPSHLDADSVRTGGPALRPALRPAQDLLAGLTRVEPTVDAVMDLLSAESAMSRFRSARSHGRPDSISLQVEALLSELSRRRHLVRQMAGLVTADTPVSRTPRLRSPRTQVSALQWALLVRAGADTTPRALACELGRSVFGTTTEIYRMVALGLMLVADQPAGAERLASVGSLARGPLTISFIRAVTDKEGD
jgi:hypothetical protein